MMSINVVFGVPPFLFLSIFVLGFVRKAAELALMDAGWQLVPQSLSVRAEEIRRQVVGRCQGPLPIRDLSSAPRKNIFKLFYNFLALGACVGWDPVSPILGFLQYF